MHIFFLVKKINNASELQKPTKAVFLPFLLSHLERGAQSKGEEGLIFLRQTLVMNSQHTFPTGLPHPGPFILGLEIYH